MEATAEDPTGASADRVRRSTATPLNQKIDRKIEDNIRYYAGSSDASVERRIHELDEEWDVERVLEVNASALALTGLALGMTRDRRWFALPAAVMGFLLQHGMQGWCPPLPLLRRLGIRTRGEIDREKHALMEVLKQRG